MAALRLLFLVLAAGVLGLVVWRSVPSRPEPVFAPSRPLAALGDAMRAPSPPSLASLPPPLPPATPPSVDRADEVPEFAGFYGRLRADFPRDYAAIQARLGRGDAPPGPDAAIWDALREVEQSEGVLAAGAAPAVLDRFFDARSAMLDGLGAVDPRGCVDFLYGLTDSATAAFTAAHRGLVATLAERMLDAIADGRGRHIDRTAPTADDLDALSAGLASFGLTPAEIALLLDGTPPDPPLPDGRLCEIGRTYLDVMHGLPAEARGRVYGLAAELLARS